MTDGFGARLRRRRMRAGLSITELAKRAGVAKGNLAKIEKDGVRSPRLRTIHKLAAALGTTVEALIAEEDESVERPCGAILPEIPEGWCVQIDTMRAGGVSDNDTLKEIAREGGQVMAVIPNPQAVSQNMVIVVYRVPLQDDEEGEERE